MTNRTEYIYNELSNAIGRYVKFPTECPLCGAKAISKECNQFDGYEYECGGQYKFKPQIQNHTNKWWGSCPIKREIARQEYGQECEGCGDKRLEYSRRSSWNCKGCGYKNNSQPVRTVKVK